MTDVRCSDHSCLDLTIKRSGCSAKACQEKALLPTCSHIPASCLGEQTVRPDDHGARVHELTQASFSERRRSPLTLSPQPARSFATARSLFGRLPGALGRHRWQGAKHLRHADSAGSEGGNVSGHSPWTKRDAGLPITTADRCFGPLWQAR